MMKVYIDNKDIEAIYNVKVLDYTQLLGIAAERDEERVWRDKSGVDPSLINARMDSREVVLKLMVKASTPLAAYGYVKTFEAYLFSKMVFVVSLRDTVSGERDCFLMRRSTAITGDTNVRYQNSLFVFKLGLKEVNPNAVKYKNTIVFNIGTGKYETSIVYTKGQNATIYWGNGDKGIVSNSGTYTKNDYTAIGAVDIIIDVDNSAASINELLAAFSANVVSGIVEHTVQFTDTSTGSPTLWSWDFGDGNTSSEQSPEHVYTTAGTYTVTLQVFNSVNGYDSEVKINYIIVRNGYLLSDDDGGALLSDDNGGKLLKT